MKAFTALYNTLDASTSTSHKVEAMQRYFAEAPQDDAAWAVYFLAGGKPRQAVPTAVLRRTACEVAGIDDWLFDACYQAVGDLAETIAHVLPAGDASDGAGLRFGRKSAWRRCAASRPKRRPPPCASGGRCSTRRSASC
jgi:DNA ligase 1